MAWYADTSALTKLLKTEAESDAMRAWFDSSGEVVTSDLARTELRRAAKRDDPDLLVGVREVLDRVSVLTLNSTTFDTAGLLDPPELRSLDALHIASALELGDDLEGIVAYDNTFLKAARANGIQTVSPGR